MYKRLLILFCVIVLIIGFLIAVIIFQSTGFKTETKAIWSDGGHYEYAIRIPDSYNGVTKIPAIIAFHNNTQSPFSFEVDSQLSKIANREGFAIIYPSWNTPSAGSAIDTFAKDIIADATKRYAIDTTRIYLIGSGTGGHMVQQLVTHDPGSFRATAMIAGFPTEENLPNKQQGTSPKPTLLIYGARDTAIPYTVFSDFMRYWTIRNGCTLSPEQVEKNDQFIYYKYALCIDKASVQAYVVKDRGDIWPGGLTDVLTRPFSDSFPTTETIINFFKEV